MQFATFEKEKNQKRVVFQIEKKTSKATLNIFSTTIFVKLESNFFSS